MNKRQKKWFNPEKHDTGWDKDMPMEMRRAKMLNAHKGNYLAAGRAMQALANVTTDTETRHKARNDALYFYGQNHQSRIRSNTRRIKFTPKVGRLPR